MSGRTPGKWVAHAAGTNNRMGASVEANGYPVASCRAYPRTTEARARANANAEFIARACNAHESVIAALRAMIELHPECRADVLNPCWDNRPADVIGRHWGGGTACEHCNARAALIAAEAYP